MDFSCNAEVVAGTVSVLLRVTYPLDVGSGSLQLWGWSVCSQQEWEKPRYGCGIFPVCEPEACSSIWLPPAPGEKSLHPEIRSNKVKNLE